jgi:hypothetical protein
MDVNPRLRICLAKPLYLGGGESGGTLIEIVFSRENLGVVEYMRNVEVSGWVADADGGSVSVCIF